MPGMSRGGGMFPGGGAGGGGGAPSWLRMPIEQQAPQGGMFGQRGQFGGGLQQQFDQSKGRVNQIQGRLWDAQRRCSGGDGAACHEAQQLQQQLQMAQQQYQQEVQLEMYKMQNRPRAGAMGVNGARGAGPTGADPYNYAATILGMQYGLGGGGLMGGGGGWG